MLGQEREHAPLRDQVTHHLPGVPQLPIRTLHTLHMKIIPSQATAARQARRHLARLFIRPLGAR